MRLYYPIFLLGILLLSIGSCYAQKQAFSSMNWQQDSSGLKYIIIRPGNAVHPDTNSYVRMRYVTLMNAEKPVDTSAIRKTVSVHDLFLDDMVRGFKLATTMLGEGGEGFFWVPPHLAYQNTEASEYREQSFIFYIAVIDRLETDKLSFSDVNLNTLLFNETTIRNANKILGAPDSTYSSWTSANIGFTCITSFITNHYYDSLHCELRFYSLDKDKKDKKLLSMITLNAGSNVRINDTLHLERCDMETVSKMFGSIGDRSAYDEKKREVYWRYPLELNGQKVIVEFVFTEEGEFLCLSIKRDKLAK